jgi:hypothetical protein
MIDVLNWKITSPFRNMEFLLPLLIEPFSTLAGLNARHHANY